MRCALMIAALLSVACQPAPQQAAIPEASPQPSRVPGWVTPEWVSRDPFAPEMRPPTPEPILPIVMTNAADLPRAPEGAVTVEGWGAIRIGMTLDQLNAVVSRPLDPNEDPDFAEYQCAYLYPAGAPDGLAVMFSDGRVSRIDVHEPGIATYGGLGVGDTSARARELLGRGLNSQPHFYSGRPAEFLTVWTQGGPVEAEGPLSPEEFEHWRRSRGVRFETGVDGKIIRFYAGNGSIEMVEGCL